MARVFSVVVSTRVLMLFLCETALIFCAYIAASFVGSDIEDPVVFLIYDSGLLRVTLATGVVVFGFYLRDLYAQLRIRNRLLLTQELAMVFGLAFIVQGAFYYLNRDLIIPRKMMITGSIMALVGVTALRLVFHFASKSEAIRPGRVLFIGLSPTVEYLARHLRAHPEFGLEPLGYLDDQPAAPFAEASGDNLARLGSLEDLYDVLDRDEPNTLVIGRREDIRPNWINEFLELWFGGLRTEDAATLYERTFGRICAAEIRPSRVIFAESLDPAPLDVSLQTAFSFLLILVTLPLSLLAAFIIAVAVKISSRGPLLEKQIRVGLYDRLFALYRFRCTDEKDELTSIGKALRKSGLDALPQLFNVLRGDMALVGPAPERPEFVEQLAEAIPFYRQRHRVKPGLTGWAQVHSEFPDKDVVRELEYDLYYVRHLSPLMNLLVMFLSLKSFFLFRGSLEN